jgi:hypothetical protein
MNTDLSNRRKKDNTEYDRTSKSSGLVGTKTNYKNIKQQNGLATPQCRLSFDFRLREKHKMKIFGSLVVSLLPPANVYTRDKFRISAKSSKLAPQMSFTQHPFRNEVSGELENLADLFTKFARDSCSSLSKTTGVTTSLLLFT